MGSQVIQPTAIYGSGTIPLPIPPIPGFNAPSSFPASNINLGDPLTGVSNELNNFNMGTLAEANGAVPASSSTSTSGASSGIASILSGILNNNPGAVAGGAATLGTTAATSSNSLLGLSLGRVGAFVMGLILIAGGIYLFGRPQINAAAGTLLRAGTAV